VYKGAETESLQKEISKALLAWNDGGKKVVKHVYLNSDLYKGPYTGNGPDLFIGFNETFRASWQTGLGAAPEGLIENNMRMWGGDHLCDPSLVPGVLATNFKLATNSASLLDIAPTILRLFHLNVEEKAEGKALIP
jgi:predicted AlkP superfamily phosphohydrolase/phosphomutase